MNHKGLNVFLMAQEKPVVEQTAALQSGEQISICRGMVFIACITDVTC